MTTQLPPRNWVERTAHRSFRYRKRSRVVADVAEEAYLRLDIACGSPACAVCAPTLPALPVAPRHLLLPDAAVLGDCLDIFELPEVDGVVLLTSTVRQLHDGGNMRRSARLRALYSDGRRRNVLFDNLHHRETAACSTRERKAGLALLAAAEWYWEHLDRRLPVVVVSDALAQQLGAPAEDCHGAGSGELVGDARRQQPQQGSLKRGAGADEGDAELDMLLQQMHIGSSGGGSHLSAVDPGGLRMQRPQLAAAPAAGPPVQLEPGVHVLSAADYFGRCWAHAPTVADVFDSIQQSKAGERGGGDGGSGGAGLKPHLSGVAIEAGLAAGTLLAGTVSVSKRVRGEASVVVGGGRALLLLGSGALNRAVHGDRVAVRVLPREHWRHTDEAAGRSDDAAAGEDAGNEEEGGDAELLAATGNGEAGVAADDAGGGEEWDAAPAPLADGGRAALQATAEVVGIVQRWSGEMVACISEDDERALAAAKHDSGRQEAALCVPMDRRLPKIRLRSRQLHRLLGQRLVLRLDGWELGSRYPHGHLVRSLGSINSLASETDGVLVSSGVHWQPFSEGALRELPPIASSAEYVMPPTELALRRDLRSPDFLTCSIDPAGCTDVDDALSVRWLGRGGDRALVEVGVHIADVSHFVRQGSQLDSEAAARCTTVYLVDRRLDMLPALLSEDLCSLRSGQDRYAVSVLWTLDADSLEVLQTWFGRTLVRSCFQLEYSQAQAILEGRPQPLQAPRAGGRGTGEVAVPPALLLPLQRNLRLLASLAEHRRQLRLQAGAVELESAELRFRTDAKGQPTDVTEIPMMRIVAEMMILANAAVGQRLHAAFPRAALLRRHPPPRRDALAEVAALCASLGTPLDLEAGPAALAASLAAAAASAPPALSSLVKSLATRAMSEAEYVCAGDAAGRGGGTGVGHFGLALPFYTHFTSPIRRYADVVVHRQLLAAVAAGGCDAPPCHGAGVPPPMPGPEVAERAAVMNERHRTAKRAQKECGDLYLLLLLHSQPHVESATIYALRPSALLVFLPKYHLKGVIHLTDKEGLCKPPLRVPGDEDLADPYVLARRRGLTLQAEGGESSGTDRGAPQQLRIVEAGSGARVAAFRPMQRVWVQLSADGSRAHGPRLRLRLLADSHPSAVQSAAREAAATPGSGPPEAAGGGAPSRPAYRPPGIPAGKAPPPGFGPGAAAAAVAAQQEAPGADPDGQARPALPSSEGALPAQSLSLAAQLEAWLEQQRRRRAGVSASTAADSGALALEATLPLVAHVPSGGDVSAGGSAAVHAVVRRLQARAARLQLRASAARPGWPHAERCGAAAAALRRQLLALQQHPVPG